MFENPCKYKYLPEGWRATNIAPIHKKGLKKM
jgi:hypothetical protein